jgi:hypothetical protein
MISKQSIFNSIIQQIGQDSYRENEQIGGKMIFLSQTLSSKWPHNPSYIIMENIDDVTQAFGHNRKYLGNSMASNTNR